MSKFYHRLYSKLYRGFDGMFYYLDDDGDLSEPFETKRLAVADMNKLPWELDLGAMLEEQEFLNKYYD